MSFKDTQSYKELQSDWRWIHEMDPEAAAAADQWVKEHPEEWKELEHMLYYSEANFHKRVAPDTLEDVDTKQPRSYNPEAFLPEEVRNAIYNDRRWFDRSKYLPEGSDEDPFMYLDTQIYDALHALTELQREILFRTVINGESTESVAQDKQCSSRNIRDIRARALRQIRAKIKRREGYGRPDVASIILLFMLLVGVPLACWGEQLWAAYPWLESVAAVLSALVMAVMPSQRSRKAAAPALGQPEWIAEKRIVVTKEGAETAKSQLLLIEWCYRRFSSSLSSLFIAAFIVTSIAYRLCFYCRLSLADVSMASAIDQTVYQIQVELMFLPGISF